MKQEDVLSTMILVFSNGESEYVVSELARAERTNNEKGLYIRFMNKSFILEDRKTYTTDGGSGKIVFRLREVFGIAGVKSIEEILAPGPVPMILTCPSCAARHYDEGEFATKPHHTHACQACGMVWRPAKVDTVGVRFLPGYKNEATP